MTDTLERQVDDEELAYVLRALVEKLDREHPWRRDALCREHPDLDWFGAPCDETRAVCARCPVRVDCSEFLGDVEKPPPAPLPVWTCKNCGERFERAQRHDRPPPIFCSARCAGLWQSTARDEAPTEAGACRS